jgi:hypothetical protein
VDSRSRRAFHWRGRGCVVASEALHWGRCMDEAAGDRPATNGAGPGPRASPSAFFVLVFSLAVPFWLVGWVTGLQLMPGLPVAGLMFVCPGLAALILAFRAGGARSAGALAKRVFDFGRIPSVAWLAPALLLEPMAKTLAFFVQRLSGSQVPVPHIALLPTIILCVIFFVSVSGVELGWSGYATEPLQARWGTVGASLILGALWAAFHYVALVEAHRSLAWIAWWTLGTLAYRVIIVWIYSGAGRSVFTASLFHMTIDVTWQLFPISGSFFDPKVSGLISAAIAVIVLLAARLMRKG